MSVSTDSPVHRLRLPNCAGPWRAFSSRDIWILDFLWRWSLQRLQRFTPFIVETRQPFLQAQVPSTKL